MDVQRLLAAGHGINVASRAVGGMLRGGGLRVVPKVKEPLLTKRHRRLRLQFAKRYQHWTVDDWERVVFPGETKVNHLGLDGRK